MSLNHKKQLREKRRAARQNPIDDLRETIKLNGITNEVITGIDGNRSVVLKDDKHNVFAYYDMQDGIPTLTCIGEKPVLKTPAIKQDVPVSQRQDHIQDAWAGTFQKSLMIADDIIGNKKHQLIVFQGHPDLSHFYATALSMGVDKNNKSRAITNTFRKPTNAV